MKHTKKALAAGLLTAASLGLSDVAHAVIFAETGDAGQTLATAENAGAATGFSGTLSTPNDADLYQFTVATAGTYTFSDVGKTADTTVTGQALDTEISLFSSTGTALVTNDDASGSTVESAFTTTLAAGTYYFGITESGNEAINSNSQLLFVGLNQSGDTTAVRGPASGVNPTTLSTFNTNSYTTDLGTYTVAITSAVPEPSTWATVALGGIASAVTFLRRRRTA